MSFRLWTIFYVFALVAAGLAAFGAWGVVVAAVVLGIWTLVFKASNPSRVFQWIVAIAIILILIALLLPSAGSPRYFRPYYTACTYNLQQLAQAILKYEEKRGSFPPAFVVDSNHAPAMSWRVSVLPLIGEQGVFSALDSTKAWDDPVNRPSLGAIDAFQCPAHVSNRPHANYFAVTGAHTAWPGDRGRPGEEFIDSKADTIVLIECATRDVHWAEPRDLSFDEAVDLLTAPSAVNDSHRVENGFFYKPSYIRHVAFANGDVEFVHGPMSRELAVALLTVDGGEKIDRRALDRAQQPELDYGTCYAFGLFVALALLPLVWVFRRKKIAMAHGAATPALAQD